MIRCYFSRKKNASRSISMFLLFNFNELFKSESRVPRTVVSERTQYKRWAWDTKQANKIYSTIDYTHQKTSASFTLASDTTNIQNTLHNHSFHTISFFVLLWDFILYIAIVCGVRYALKRFPTLYQLYTNLNRIESETNNNIYTTTCIVLFIISVDASHRQQGYIWL